MSSTIFNTLFVCVICAALAAAQFDKTKAVGPCINGKCPEGHVCHEEECFPAPPPQNDENNLNNMYDDENPRGQPIGPCINNLCPAGYTCNQQDYKCY
ncbi:hypothetical protein M3Y97_00696500 [Aphelenchoides bicaudatus]|nr:hypothetical protein M3Y97_00696500 [Aphelenchoides bicaudatus]